MMTTSKVQEKLTNKDLNKLVIHGLGGEFSWNYERQGNITYAKMMSPVLRKIYKNDEKKYQEALERNLEFFNITPYFIQFVGGITASLEEENAVSDDFDTSTISNIKVALMGPLSGIGDSIFYGGIRVIALGIGLPLAAQGNMLGPILYALIYNLPAFAVRIAGSRLGYKLGYGYLKQVQDTGVLNKLLSASGILAMMVIGGMTMGMVGVNLNISMGTGDTATSLQEVIDSILPGMLTLVVTGIYYWLLGKKVNPIWLILGTIVVGIAGVWLGIFAV